ncbi:MAG: ATP-binding protein [Myxococcota bacterium]|nr:ATP-binding protein [Myxococcota bacterium]MEC8423846.1 ATP-binding protein [Myxococcota bacterium]
MSEEPASPFRDEALASVLVARSPNGVLVTDGDGRVRVVNPALGQVIPLVPNAIGRHVADVIPVDALIEALDPARVDEVELALRIGNRDLLVRVVPLGDLRGRLAILQDVTTLRQAERYRSEFVGNVSHELRTPATAIAGYAETLLEDRDTLDPYVGDMVEVIHRNARRLTDLFDDLLTLTRLDAQQGPLPSTEMGLAPMIAEAIDKAQAMADAKRIHFEVLVPTGMKVRANRDAMGHIVGNLVTNAVKYSHDDGVVTVRAQYRDRWVLLEVIDVGIGIDPVHHARVFERFFRVDKGRARKAGGTGLGLSIVKKLVDQMGCAIEVKSRKGDGSVFRVLLHPAR